MSPACSAFFHTGRHRADGTRSGPAVAAMMTPPGVCDAAATPVNSASVSPARTAVTPFSANAAAKSFRFRRPSASALAEIKSVTRGRANVSRRPRTKRRTSLVPDAMSSLGYRGSVTSTTSAVGVRRSQVSDFSAAASASSEKSSVDFRPIRSFTAARGSSKIVSGRPKAATN